MPTATTAATDDLRSVIKEGAGSVSNQNDRPVVPPTGSTSILASLIECCKLNGIEPQTYLASVLDRLVNLWPNNRLDELFPWAWAKVSQQLQRAA